jgi:hypothetical protein
MAGEALPWMLRCTLDILNMTNHYKPLLNFPIRSSCPFSNCVRSASRSSRYYDQGTFQRTISYFMHVLLPSVYNCSSLGSFVLDASEQEIFVWFDTMKGLGGIRGQQNSKLLHEFAHFL